MKKNRKIFILYIILFLGLNFSCSESQLPDFNKLDKPRIIALVANKPEANPAEPTITITPVISDLAAVVGVRDSAQVCIDFGIAFGVDPTCENNLTKIILFSFRSLSLPGLASSWTGSADSFSFSIPSAAVIFSQRSSQDMYNGVNYLVEYTLHSPSGQNIKTIKRIVITESAKVLKNTNPVLTNIFADGTAMTNLPINTSVTVTSNLSSSSAENYSTKDTSGNLKNYTEELAVTWFITDGVTKFYRSEVNQGNKYDGPVSAPAGRKGYIFAVARDNRGGVAIVKQQLN